MLCTPFQPFLSHISNMSFTLYLNSTFDRSTYDTISINKTEDETKPYRVTARHDLTRYVKCDSKQHIKHGDSNYIIEYITDVLALLMNDIGDKPYCGIDVVVPMYPSVALSINETTKDIVLRILRRWI